MLSNVSLEQHHTFSFVMKIFHGIFFVGVSISLSLQKYVFLEYFREIFFKHLFIILWSIPVANLVLKKKFGGEKNLSEIPFKYVDLE